MADDSLGAIELKSGGKARQGKARRGGDCAVRSGACRVAWGMRRAGYWAGCVVCGCVLGGGGVFVLVCLFAGVVFVCVCACV